MKYGQDFISGLVVKRNREAELLILKLLESDHQQKETVNCIIRKYLCLKFSLDESDITDENIIYLAKISIKKASSKNEIYWDRKDCHGATESMTKKVLFITSIERYLKFQFTTEEYLHIDTVSDLSAAVYHHLMG